MSCPVLSMLFIYFQSYTNYLSCCPPNVHSVFLAWFSCLHLILYDSEPKFLCSVAFLTVISLLISIPSLICDHLLFMSPSFHLNVSGRNNSTRESLSSPAQTRHLPLSPTPPLLISRLLDRNTLCTFSL